MGSAVTIGNIRRGNIINITRVRLFIVSLILLLAKGKKKGLLLY